MTECKHDWVGRCGKLSQGHCFSCLEARAEAAERERDAYCRAFYVPLSVRDGQMTPEEWAVKSEAWLEGLQKRAARAEAAEAALERVRCLVGKISKVLSPPADPVQAPEPVTCQNPYHLKSGNHQGTCYTLKSPEPVRTEGAPKQEESVRTLNAEESAARKRILARLFVPVEPPKPEEPEMADFEIAPAAAMQMVLDERDALRARVAELEAIVKIWRESAELRAQECPECTAVAPSHKFSCSRMGGGQLVVSVDRVVAPEAPGEKEGGA